MASNTLTFPIDSKKVSLIKQWKLRVRKLFEVNVEIDDASPGIHERKTWISLRSETASEDQYQKAKNYILSHVEPEITISLENVVLTRDVRDEIERESGTHMVEQDGTVTINGAEIHVAIAKSLLQQKSAARSKAEQHSTKSLSKVEENPRSSKNRGCEAPQNSTAQESRKNAARRMKSCSPTPQGHAGGMFSGHNDQGLIHLSPSRIHSSNTKDPLANTMNDRCISQLSYLEDFGQTAGYSLSEIEETLLQFDINGVIKPVEFQTALAQLREMGGSLPGVGRCWSSLVRSSESSLGEVKGGISSSSPHHGYPPPPPQFHSPSQKDDPSVKCFESTSSDDEDEPFGITDSRSRAAPSQAGAVATSRKSALRYVVIDGSNVAMKHGNGKVFSVKGIQIVLKYFLDRGHKVTAFVPQSRLYRTNPVPISNRKLLDRLNEDGLLKFSPARRIDGKAMVCYDDRYILNLAESTQGIVVSNDQFRDLLDEKPNYREIIQRRLLMFEFVNDFFMPPDDPLGRNGPMLEAFLRMPKTHKPASVRSRSQPQHRSPQTRQQRELLQTKEKNQRSFSDNKTAKNEQGATPKTQWASAATPKTQWDSAATAQRSEQQTRTLLDELLRIFPEPNQKPIVRSILQNHRTETDLLRLSNYCLNVIPH